MRRAKPHRRGSTLAASRTKREETPRTPVWLLGVRRGKVVETQFTAVKHEIMIKFRCLKELYGGSQVIAMLYKDTFYTLKNVYASTDLFGHLLYSPDSIGHLLRTDMIIERFYAIYAIRFVIKRKLQREPRAHLPPRLDRHTPALAFGVFPDRCQT